MEFSDELPSRYLRNNRKMLYHPLQKTGGLFPGAWNLRIQNIMDVINLWNNVDNVDESGCRPYLS